MQRTRKVGYGFLVYLGRIRKMPRVRSFRPCVRARFDAVEMPLNKIKKSRNARKKPFSILLPIGKNLTREAGAA